MHKRFYVFLQLLIWGIVVGVIEDMIIIKILTDKTITLQILIIITLVTIPFAFVGEYIIDRIDFIKIFKLDEKYKKAEVFLEFFIFGVLLGVTEDLTAFHFAVGEPITWHVVLVVIAVAVPFAFVGEYIVDRLDFISSIKAKKIIWKK